MIRKRLALLTLCVFVPTIGASVSEVRRGAISLDTEITVPGNQILFSELLSVAHTNSIPLGVTVDSGHQFCKQQLTGGRRTLRLADYIDQINALPVNYRAALTNGVLEVHPAFDPEARRFLDLMISEFHTKPDTQDGLGVRLWMWIRSVIAPGEGTGFTGASSTQREIVEGINSSHASVQSLLNQIVSKGKGGVWVLQSSQVQALDNRTVLPYRIVPYANPEDVLNTVKCVE